MSKFRLGTLGFISNWTMIVTLQSLIQIAFQTMNKGQVNPERSAFIVQVTLTFVPAMLLLISRKYKRDLLVKLAICTALLGKVVRLFDFSTQR